MTVLAANALDATKFFKESNPVEQGSSFDPTVGSIFDHTGTKVAGPFVLEPGHTVQVISAEVFNLPANVTGHVTYKTSLTQKGIWALTVGIVDPGWDGPISTTLLNFSKVAYAISEGDAFLRVILLEHAPAKDEKLRKAPRQDVYVKEVQRAAATLFPRTFLDKDAIAIQAGQRVMEQIRNQALAWIAGIAILFTLMQFIADFASFKLSNPPPSAGIAAWREAVAELNRELASVKGQLEELGARTASGGGSPMKPADRTASPD